MSNTNAERDENRVTVALGLLNDGSGSVAPIKVDSVTGRVLFDILAE